MLLGRIACIAQAYMRHIATDGVASVCLLVTTVSRAETAEPIEMPLRASAWVGLNHVVLDESPHCPRGKAHFFVLRSERATACIIETVRDNYVYSLKQFTTVTINSSNKGRQIKCLGERQITKVKQK